MQKYSFQAFSQPSVPWTKETSRLQGFFLFLKLFFIFLKLFFYFFKTFFFFIKTFFFFDCKRWVTMHSISTLVQNDLPHLLQPGTSQCYPGKSRRGPPRRRWHTCWSEPWRMRLTGLAPSRRSCGFLISTKKKVKICFNITFIQVEFVMRVCNCVLPILFSILLSFNMIDILLLTQVSC